MKKLLLCLIALLLGITPLAQGETKGATVEERYYQAFDNYSYQEGDRAVVANFRVGDRLNLRAEADTKSTSLGRIYSGTPLTVLGEAAGSDGETSWLHVKIGSLTGYAQKKYIMPMNRNYEAPNLFYTAVVNASSAALRAEPKNTAAVLTTLSSNLASGTLYVLGDMGDDWRYVMLEGQYGYLRTAQLRELKCAIPLAYARAADGGDAVTVYSDEDMKKSVATLCTGVPLRVTGVSRAGGWAAVDSCGTVWSEEYTGQRISGYLALEDLLVFAQRWQVEERFHAAKVLSAVEFQDEISNMSRSVAPGTLLSVLGEKGDSYLVALDGGVGFVEKTRLFCTGGAATREGPEAVGYAKLRILPGTDGWRVYPQARFAPDGAEQGEVYEGMAEVIDHRDGWYQLRTQQWNTFFLPEEDVLSVIGADALYPQTKARHGAGEWTVSAGEAGLYLFTVPKGEEGTLTLSRPGEEEEMTYAPGGHPAGESAAYYTVYLPEGTRARLTGAGEVAAAGEETLPVISGKYPTRIPDEAEIIFSGSGRFFFEDQLASDGSWYSYWIRPLPGAEDSYYVQSTLFEEADAIYLDENNTETLVDGRPGEFLEIHNCQITIYFGNG